MHKLSLKPTHKPVAEYFRALQHLKSPAPCPPSICPPEIRGGVCIDTAHLIAYN